MIGLKQEAAYLMAVIPWQMAQNLMGKNQNPDKLSRETMAATEVLRRAMDIKNNAIPYILAGCVFWSCLSTFNIGMWR